MKLLYIHIGNTVPIYLIDSIYQSILITGGLTKIYILVNKIHKETLQQNLNNLNYAQYLETCIPIQDIIEIVPLELFNINDFIYTKSELINKQFRNGFWFYTTLRFIYITLFMRKFSIDHILHIENDVMLYKLPHVENKLGLIQDSVARVVPSMIYISNYKDLENFVLFIENYFKTNMNFKNDMELLGMYANMYPRRIFKFNHLPNNNEEICDGAAIGQLIGGIDPKNLTNVNEFDNPSIGFINETCNVKYNRKMITTEFQTKSNIKVPLKIYKYNKQYIVNLHIHSKQLYQFSSINHVPFKEIITGDRILQNCDFIICSQSILNYHKYLSEFNKKIILVKNYHSIDFYTLNNIFLDFNQNTIKLGLYTHELHYFQQYILPMLPFSKKFILYIHNSDHEFGLQYSELINSPKIFKIYAQNVNIPLNPKVFYLPIGLANKMWPHGNIDQFYKIYRETCFMKKSKNLYININPNTFNYRRVLLNQISELNFNITRENKTFLEYLKDLSQHRFSLCVRGNGIQTHRFDESLYLNVIPVIINNKETNMQAHVDYLVSMNIPFYEIKDISEYSDDFFNEELYQNILNKYFYKCYLSTVFK